MAWEWYKALTKRLKKPQIVWCQKCENIGKLYIVNLGTGVTDEFPCDACDGKGYTNVAGENQTTFP